MILRPQIRLNYSLMRHVPANRNLTLETSASISSTDRTVPCNILSIHVIYLLTYLLTPWTYITLFNPSKDNWICKEIKSKL